MIYYKKFIINFLLFLLIFIKLNITIFSQNIVKKDLFLNKKYIRAYRLYLKGKSKKQGYNKAVIFNKAIQICNCFPEPYFELAVFYYKNSEFKETEDMLRKAFKYRNYFKVLQEKIRFHKFFIKFYDTQNKYEECIFNLKELQKIKSESNNLFLLGKYYYLNKKYSDSVHFLKKYLLFCRDENNRLNYKKTFDTYEFLSDSYIHLSKFKKALDVLQEYYSKKPSKNILKKISILSNNLQYYDKK